MNKILTQIGNQRLDFFYDENDSVVAFKYNNAMYYYFKNAQGDIYAIVDSTGAKVAQYTYDAWGNILTVKDGNGVAVASTDLTHVANMNPFRYRGYYYDTETKLYYLQSRYYDPAMGRFLCTDAILYPSQNVKSINIFTYCMNNPVNNSDYAGFETWQQMAERHLYHNRNVWAIEKSGITLNFNSKAFINKQNKTKNMLNGRKYVPKLITMPITGFVIAVLGRYEDLRSDYNGCGWIAIYNTLLVLGKTVDPSSIIYWMETNNGLNLGGLLGSNVASICKYFAKRNYTVRKGVMIPSKTNLKTLEGRIKTCKVAIIRYFWHNEDENTYGGHYITIYWDAKISKFQIFNDYIRFVASLEEFAKDSGMIRFAIIDYILIN